MKRQYKSFSDIKGATDIFLARTVIPAHFLSDVLYCDSGWFCNNIIVVKRTSKSVTYFSLGGALLAELGGGMDGLQDTDKFLETGTLTWT
jgi:hypothetical protein